MPRPLFALLLALLLAAPLLPVLAPLAQPQSYSAFAEADRLGSLLANTFALAALSVLIAAPFGCLLAVVIARGPARPARLLRAVVLVGLAVPLPVVAVAWQAVLGAWLPAALAPGVVEWRAWNEGLLPAAWVHGMAGVAWVAWVAGGVLRRTDQTLEDDAALLGGWAAVLRRVVLPRTLLAALVAGGWVAAQTATEITITDAMRVRTFAEEVYTQLVVDTSKVGAAVAVSVPVWVLGVAAGVLLARRVRVSADVNTPRPLLGGWWVAVGALIVSLFAGLPLAALVWKAGGGFRLGELFNQLLLAAQANGAVLLNSVLWAAVAGVVAAWLARRACVTAARSPGFARFLFVLCVLLLLTPGPLVGFGLKGTCLRLALLEDFALGGRDAVPFHPLAWLLWEQPSPLPVLWAAVIRLFPVACVVVWPAARAIPAELWEASDLDCGGRRAGWRRVAEPLTRRAFAAATAGAAALALGEISAGKIAAPPGYDSFILRLFAQMHYGAEAAVAALALVQIVATAGVLGLGLLVRGKSEE